MTSSASTYAHPPHPHCMDDSDSAQSLLGKKFAAIKAGWSADAADIFVLLSSLLLTTASIILIALVFYAQAHHLPLPKLSSILQRVISTLSTTITSAVVMVVGKRYVLFKFARGGMRSRRVALYSRSSIGNLAYYLVCGSVELPLLALLGVWSLGLVTGLTANDTWVTIPPVVKPPIVPSGPLDAAVAPGSLLILASAQLSQTIALMCSGLTYHATGIVSVNGSMKLASGGPAGLFVYPPLLGYIPNGAFSVSAPLNGFNISMELLSSLPPTAQNLTCVDAVAYEFSTGQLWYGGGDNQTLSIIATFNNPPYSTSLYRFNASAVILGGLVQSTGNGVEFVPNGTTWPNVMSSNQWALDIASLVCNTTYTNMGDCVGGSLLTFASWFNGGLFSAGNETLAGIYWSTALGMAMGAYSSVSPLGNFWNWTTAVSTDFPYVPSVQLTSHYGIYVLIANVVVSSLMLVVAVRLRMASRLSGDFIDTTRLLLDALKNPELFNASLGTTVNTLGNPNMQVRKGNEFLLEEQAPSEGKPTAPETF